MLNKLYQLLDKYESQAQSYRAMLKRQNRTCNKELYSEAMVRVIIAKIEILETV